MKVIFSEIDAEQKCLAYVIRRLKKFDWDNDKAQEVRYKLYKKITNFSIHQFVKIGSLYNLTYILNFISLHVELFIFDKKKTPCLSFWPFSGEKLKKNRLLSITETNYIRDKP